MILDSYDPLKQEMFNVIDDNGKVVNKDYEPDIDNETLINMYKTMQLARIADVKALQYQRQGRMLTFAPVKGQEGAQVGPMAAAEDDDWLVPSFREMAAMLYKGVPLKQLYLYWYGNEQGSKFEQNVMPVNVPIGSQINHAAGIAMASSIRGKNQVAISFIGDGGTSHGEFHEGMNFAGVYDAPMVTIIQNNQYAISTPRQMQSKSETLAQKAISYGIPGIQVDGNDPLAMYAATKEALNRARAGKGPTLIEAVTYRQGPHTTSDDPSIYRSEEEVKNWQKKDPISRFRKYISNKKLWNKEKDEALQDEYKDFVKETFKAVEKYPTPTVDEVFDYTYAEMPKTIKAQKEAYKAYLKEREGE